MDTRIFQHELFNSIRTRLPPDDSLVDVISSLLDLSHDSAYRRIRGEKQILIEELLKLCKHFNLSFDHLLSIDNKIFSFTGDIAETGTFDFGDYMTNMMKTMMYLNSFEQKEFYYLSKDVPVFYHFLFRELAAFKYFFWMKTVLQKPEFSKRKVSFEDYDETFFIKGQKGLECYKEINGIELWNLETLNSTLRQIDFYSEAQFFKSRDDVWLMYETVEKLIEHIEKQAEAGYKFGIGDKEMKPLGTYRLYFNEVILADNSMLLILDEAKVVFLVHSAINYMSTRDIPFCNNMYNYFQAMMKKSTLISSVSEKERTRFFRQLRDKISRRKRRID